VFAVTLTVTDIHSGWTVCEAVLGKESKTVLQAMKNIESKLPFKIKAICSDNGTEFINHDFLEEYVNLRQDQKVLLFRGQSYRKNDQAYVEQKNYTNVRQLFVNDSRNTPFL
jgi:IS30 family transposase